MMSMGAGAAAAAVAAETSRLMREEEEEMTPYRDKDLAEGWEFKIVRGAFRKPEQLRAVLEEEKQGGWTLVEKFDDSRIRLKRPAGAKRVEGDFAEGYDPYRTTVRSAGEQRFLIIAVAVGAALLALMLIAILGTR